MSTIIGTNGGDTLYGGAGDDLIIGDRLLFTFPGETDPTIGHDIVYGGAGNDTIIGDVQTYTGHLTSLSDLFSPFFPTYQVGNELHGDTGNDFICGIFQYGTFTATGISVDFADFGFPIPPIPNDPTGTPPIEFIYGGSGNDVLVGNTGYATNIAENNAHIGNFLNPHVSTHIEGGNGDDLLNGGCLISTIIATNGSSWQNSLINFNSGELYGNNGNDTIYGSDELYHIIAQNNSHFDNVALNYSGDTIDGGNGNDTIDGDIGTLKIEVDNTSSVDLQFYFGADKITGGEGNDVIFGDVGNINLVGLAMSDLNSMIVASSTGDNIDGGNGNDFISGQWDDDILTGSKGNDTFAYYSQINNGHDTITDFNVTTDILKGDQAGMFSDGGHDGNGNLIVNVHDLGTNSTITMIGIHDFASLHIII